MLKRLKRCVTLSSIRQNVIRKRVLNFLNGPCAYLDLYDVNDLDSIYLSFVVPVFSKTGVETKLTEQDNHSRPGTPCCSTDAERRMSPEPVAAVGEVTSTTSGTSPEPIENFSGRRREMGTSGKSAFRPISLDSQKFIGSENERHNLSSASYSGKVNQVPYDDHIRLLHYPLITPRNLLDIPSPPRAHYRHTISGRENDRLLMARHEFPYLQMAHASLPRLDLMGYTDPRMPITNYYLTAARMQYEQHHHAMMAALHRDNLVRREERHPVTPTISPRKSEIDMIKTPVSDKNRKSPLRNETVSSPESLSGGHVQDLSRKRKYSSSNEDKTDLERSRLDSSDSSRSSPREFHSGSLHQSGETYPLPSNLSLSPPSTMVCSSSPMTSVGRNPILPGFPSPLEARYNRPISPPAFSMLPGN